MGIYATANNLVNADSNDDLALGFVEEDEDFELDADNYVERNESLEELIGGGEEDDTEYCYEDANGEQYCRIGQNTNQLTSEGGKPVEYDGATQDDGCLNSIGCVSKVEKQYKENLCWAYAYTTAIESTIKNQLLEETELSVKHLDYILSGNSFTNNESNPYTNHFGIGKINNNSRPLSAGANFLHASTVSTGKYTLVEEDKFWQDLQNTNSSLQSYNSYADFLAESENNELGYREKINKNIVLNNSNSDYNLTSYKSVDSKLLYYGEDKVSDKEGLSHYSREEFISFLKMSISEYGAVGVNTHFNKDNCAYINGSNYTFIDRTTRNNLNVCGLNSGHAVTLVGWDDDWTYIDNGITKKGAFVVQNTHGIYSAEYLTYDSAITSFFIATGVEHNNYENVYDYTDQLGSYSASPSNQNKLEYNSPKNINPNGNELIFEFQTRTGQEEKIERISFSQRTKMAGAEYMFFISYDDGENWSKLTDDWYTMQFDYPGMQSINLSSRNVRVNGDFAIKVYSGYTDEGDLRPNYAGDDFTDYEKKYDLVNVYTSNVSNTTPAENHTVTFVTNNQDYVTLSKTSISVADGTRISFSANSASVLDANSNEIDRITATITRQHPQAPNYEYRINWDYGTDDFYPDVIKSDRTIYAKVYEAPKEYTVKFQTDYTDASNNAVTLTYGENELAYGSNPIYTGSEPVKKTNRDDVSYVFSGWEPEITPVVGSAVYTATFDTIYTDYNITYSLNGGENNLSNPSTYTTESAISLASPTRAGYTFRGWYNNENFEGNPIASTAGLTGDLALYAKWELETYNITYNSNGGILAISPEDLSYTAERSVTFKEPLKDRYDFRGWYTSENFDGNPVTSTTGLSGNLTLYAKWAPKSYSITYVNGGQNNPNPSTYTAETVVNFANPSRAGYTFRGWYKDGNAITSTAGLTGDITIRAEWELEAYNISYVLNGGTLSFENPETYTVENNAIFNNPEKEYYDFRGWYTSENFDGNPITSTTGLSGDLTLYAKWTKDSSKQPNNGQNGSSDSDNHDNPNDGSSQNPNQDTDTDKEKKSYTINYVLDGGENNSKNPTTLKIGEQAVLEDPTKAGYTFLGWYDNPSFSGKKVLKIQQGTSEVTLYAKWQKNPEKESEKKESSKSKQDNRVSNVPETSSSQGSKSANTGYSEEDDTFIQGDTYLAVMAISVVGFVAYIIRTRRRHSRVK